MFLWLHLKNKTSILVLKYSHRLAAPNTSWHLHKFYLRPWWQRTKSQYKCSGLCYNYICSRSVTRFTYMEFSFVLFVDMLIRMIKEGRGEDAFLIRRRVLKLMDNTVILATSKVTLIKKQTPLSVLQWVWLENKAKQLILVGSLWFIVIDRWVFESLLIEASWLHLNYVWRKIETLMQSLLFVQNMSYHADSICLSATFHVRRWTGMMVA